MKLEINPRGNGACPLCKSAKSCCVQRQLKSNCDNFSTSDEDGMEIVVYSCPFFTEKVTQ